MSSSSFETRGWTPSIDATSKSSKEVFYTLISCSSIRLISCWPLIRPTGAASTRMASLRTPALNFLLVMISPCLWVLRLPRTRCTVGAWALEAISGTPSQENGKLYASRFGSCINVSDCMRHDQIRGRDHVSTMSAPFRVRRQLDIRISDN